jgi:hypothetical protein
MTAATTSLAVMAWSGSTLAAEDADGSSLSGPPMSSYAGLTSSSQGLAWQTRSAYAAGPSTQASQLADASLTSAALNSASMFPSVSSFRAWGPTLGRWSFGSQMTVPEGVPSVPADAAAASWTAHQQVGDIGGGNVAFAPVVASYHINQTDRLAFSMGVSAPTMSFQHGRYVYAGANVWTVTPKVAYTKVLSSSGVESSTIVAVGTFSRKSVEDYQNGAVGRIEAVVMERNPNGWGFGGVAAAIQQQYTNPTTMAGRSPNYSNMGGLAMGVGPQVSFSTRWLGSNVELQYRWIYEFSAPNGHADQPMLLSATLHL